MFQLSNEEVNSSCSCCGILAIYGMAIGINGAAAGAIGHQILASHNLVA